MPLEGLISLYNTGGWLLKENLSGQSRGEAEIFTYETTRGFKSANLI